MSNTTRLLYGLLALFLAVSPAFAEINATATITPRVVDTNVADQAFVYLINVSNETANNVVINAPQNFTITAVSDVTLNGTSCISTSCPNRSVTSSSISINFTPAFSAVANNPIRVTFSVNTSGAAQTSNFTSTINSTTNQHSVPSLNITVVAQQLVTMSNVIATKTVALVNGSDYWEFNFKINITEVASGMLQFKMASWNNSAGTELALTSGSTSLATLRNLTTYDGQINNGTYGIFNVSSSYAANTGLLYSATAPFTIVDAYLRMVIPTGTPISSNWFTTYSMLFRSS